MMNVVTPSAVQPMTDGQIDKAVDIYRAVLRKHRPELGSDAVQYVLGQPEYVAEQVAVLRKRVEAISSMIVRRVRVDRTRSSHEAIDATGRIKDLDDIAVASMPQGEGEEVDVYFFKPDESAYDKNGLISDDEVARQFDKHGFKPDPRAQAAVNQADPAFADEYPNGTHWKDADGKWCIAAFDRWSDGRDVSVSRGDSDWFDSWWFGGVRK